MLLCNRSQLREVPTSGSLSAQLRTVRFEDEKNFEKDDLSLTSGGNLEQQEVLTGAPRHEPQYVPQEKTRTSTQAIPEATCVRQSGRVSKTPKHLSDYVT